MSDSFLVVTQYFPPERGAAQVRLGAITAELVRRGHTVDVVTVQHEPAAQTTHAEKPDDGV